MFIHQGVEHDCNTHLCVFVCCGPVYSDEGLPLSVHTMFSDGDRRIHDIRHDHIGSKKNPGLLCGRQLCSSIAQYSPCGGGKIRRLLPLSLCASGPRRPAVTCRSMSSLMSMSSHSQTRPFARRWCCLTRIVSLVPSHSCVSTQIWMINHQQTSPSCGVSVIDHVVWGSCI